MLDHVTVAVADVGAAKAFHDRALLPLGIMRLFADAAVDQASVDRFYEAALAAGEKDNGAPG
jgi:hypothetical protein